MYDEYYLIEGDVDIHPIAKLIPEMDGDEYHALKEDISGIGVIHPVVMYEGMILDGRHRYNICRELDIDLYGHDFDESMDPVEYVVSENVKRRHLSKSQIAMVAASVMDYLVEDAKRRQVESGKDYGRGGTKVVETLPQPINQDPQPEKQDQSKKAREQAGKLFNVSGRTIGDAQTVTKNGTEEEKQAVVSGKSSVSSVAKQVRERKKAEPRPAEKQAFNATNDNIEWAKWSWNPVTGCRYGCKYCYARDIANRFFEHKFEPHYYPERLSAPVNTKIPKKRIDEPGIKNVFVCSMADLFGSWVPDEWIENVINVCIENKQWNFLFLTKNPKRYLDFDFPPNCWIGATADNQKRADIACIVFNQISEEKDFEGVKFLSCEPMEESIVLPEENNYLPFDWIIIGGRSGTTGMPEHQPEWMDWFNLTQQAVNCGVKVYFKPNLTAMPKEYPE